MDYNRPQTYDYSNNQANQPYPDQYQQPVPDYGYVGAGSNSLKQRLAGFKFAKLASPIGVFIILQLIVIVLLVVIINPKRVYNNYKQDRVIARAEELAKVDPAQKPVVAVVSDAEKLRGEEPVQKEVYKDAKNGDYVLAYTDTLIIYRKNEDKLIYSGDTPRVLLSKSQQELIKGLTEAVTKQELVSADAAKSPQLLAVTDPAKLRKQDANFFALAKESDLIAYFPDAEVVVLYRPAEGKILNSGTYKTQISKP